MEQIFHGLLLPGVIVVTVIPLPFAIYFWYVLLPVLGYLVMVIEGIFAGIGADIVLLIAYKTLLGSIHSLSEVKRSVYDQFKFVSHLKSNWESLPSLGIIGGLVFVLGSPWMTPLYMLIMYLVLNSFFIHSLILTSNHSNAAPGAFWFGLIAFVISGNVRKHNKKTAAFDIAVKSKSK